MQPSGNGIYRVNDTCAPTNAPTPQTQEPTPSPTDPTGVPTGIPSFSPTTTPTALPTIAPSMSPTTLPSQAPSFSPSLAPSGTPSLPPTASPTEFPTASPISRLTFLDKIYFNNSAISSGLAGTSLAIYGEYAVAGDMWCDVTQWDTDAGCAFVYKLNGETGEWNYTQQLIAVDYDSDAYFGRSVAISENYILIGAYGVNQAYVFKKNDANPEGSRWSYKRKLTPYSGADSGVFGWTVALTDEYAIVGDHNNNDEATRAGITF